MDVRIVWGRADGWKWMSIGMVERLLLMCHNLKYHKYIRYKVRK